MRILAPAVLAAAILSPAALSMLLGAAQDSAPVTVSDSPVAWQLLQQAEDQARENPGEAARLCQRLLDEYSDKLIPADETPGDRFENVVERVEQFLRSHPSVLERYRQSEEPEAERRAASQPGEMIARSRGLTAEGLRATLRVAERDIDAGRLGQALLRLERARNHPDLAGEGPEGSAYWGLVGLAATLDGRSRERAEALSRLTALQSEAADATIVALERLAGVGPQSVDEPVNPLSLGVPPAEGERGWQPVWTESLGSTPFARSMVGRLESPIAFSPREMDRARFDGSLSVVAPTVIGDLVLVSDGSSIRALDRLSHRMIWYQSVGLGIADRTGTPPCDLASIAVGEGAVVLFPGLATGSDRGAAGRVVCIELADGQERWDVPLASLGGEEFRELFPIGEAAIADGAVFFLARKVTSRLETVEYLISLDLSTGALRWGTHIASCGGVRLQGLRSCSRPIVADGSVWVSTSVGSAARVDASDGRILWLHRFLVPVRTSRYESEPWELGGPAVTAGWLFTIAPDQSEVVQLERGSGRRVRSFPTGATAAWGTPRYLVTDPGDGLRRPQIYAIGADIIAFDPEDPAKPLWSFGQANAQRFVDRPGLANRTGVRGRVQATGDILVVPGLDDVLLVSRESGRVREAITIDGPANPTISGPQLFLGQNAGVTALMPAASAERLMRERMARAPENPEGALALLDLGLRTSRLAICLEAAEAAKPAVLASARADAREELIARLLRAAMLEEARGPAGDAVHALIGEVAVTPDQRVRHLLARGDWLAGLQRGAEAVAAYDLVLADPALRSVLVESDPGSSVAAAIRTRSLLASLETTAGRAFEARNAAAAARLAAAGGDPEVLTELIESAPGTPAALSASLALGRSDGRAGLVAALRGLRQVPGGAEQDRTIAALLAAAAGNARARGAHRALADMADALLAGGVGRSNLAIPLLEGSVPLQSLARSMTPPPAMIGGTPGEAIELPGRLVRFAGNAESDRRLSGLLLAHERTLSYRPWPAFDAQWTLALEDRDPVVLTAHGPIGERVLLWQEAGEGDAFASLIDLASGEVVARTPPLVEVLPPEAVLDAGRPPSQLMPNETPYLPGQVLPMVVGERLVLIRRNGDAVAFALNNLSTPVWSRQRMLDQVYEISPIDWGIAIGGRLPGPRAGGPPAIAVIDPVDGAVVSERTLGVSDDPVEESFGGSPEDVRWMRLCPGGELLVGSDDAVEALDALTPNATTLWRLASGAARSSVGAWRFGTTAVLADRSDSLTAIDLADGSLRPDRFRTPLRNEARQPTLRGGGRAGDFSLVQFEDRVVAFTRDGVLVGEDAVSDERNYLFATPIDGAVVVVNALGSRQVPSPLTGGMRTEFAYLVYRLGLADGLRLLGPSLQVRIASQRCERIGIADGYLFFSTNSTTLVIPVPASP